MIKPVESIIVKPTGARCNLSCDYCFYLEKEDLYPMLSVMDENTLQKLISQLSDQTGAQYNITWQGGEPTMAGLNFFRKVIELQISSGQTNPKIIGNSLQTNGTLLNDEWIIFLKEYNFLVGLSLDGPESFHNKSRVFSSGKGSWEMAYINGKKLLQAGVEVNILSCITSNNVTSPDVLYNFYKSEGYHWLQFNPIYEVDEGNKPKEFSVNANDLGNFMCRIFDLWFDDYLNENNAPIVRFIENAFHAHLGLKVPECSFQETCGGYLVIEHNGDAYSCDFFVNESNKLGNINNSRLFDLLNSNNQREFGLIKGKYETSCNSCPWLKMCYGGCPKYRNPDTNKHFFCNAYKRFYNYSNDRLTKLAEIWLENNNENRKGTFDSSGYFK